MNVSFAVCVKQDLHNVNIWTEKRHIGLGYPRLAAVGENQGLLGNGLTSLGIVKPYNALRCRKCTSGHYADDPLSRSG